MSAQPTYPRADKAAREVDPMLMAQALDHIARTAHHSRTQTRRLRWIARRAEIALDGGEYRDIDVELPEHATEDRMVDLKSKCTRLRKDNEALLAVLRPIVAHANRIDQDAASRGVRITRTPELAALLTSAREILGTT